MNNLSIAVGRTFFRFRSYVPVVIYAAMVVMPPVAFSPEPMLWVAGACVTGFGVWLRLWSIRHIGKRARTRGDKARFLIVGGPFSIMRNPLYVANMATGCGFCIAFGLPWFVPAYMFLIGLFYVFVVRYEEAFLAHRFGTSYARYAASVPRWIPDIGSTPKRACVYPWHKVLRWERSYLGILAAGFIALVVRKMIWS